jgi:hypothetical protein
MTKHPSLFLECKLQKKFCKITEGITLAVLSPKSDVIIVTIVSFHLPSGMGWLLWRRDFDADKHTSNDWSYVEPLCKPRYCG